MLWLHLTQYSGFLYAQVTNSILIYLIVEKSEKLLGSYRFVMGTFSMFSLIYSWIEIVTQPIIYIKPPMFILFMNSPLKYEKWIGNNITCLFCGSFALVISLLATQFFYRYIALCKPEILLKFKGNNLILIFIPSLIFFVIWFEFVYWGMANTVEKQEYINEELNQYYGENSTRVSFIAPMYWSIGKNGEKIWKFEEVMAFVGCTSIIVICFSTILFCAFNMYKTMKNNQSHMSAKTLSLNRQLFTTLAFQTILPFFLMYLPVGLLITMPILNIYGGRIGNFPGASVAIYPSLEPVIAMICIKEFRKFFKCRWRKVEAESQTPKITGQSGPV